MVKLSSKQIVDKYDKFASKYEIAELFVSLIIGRKRRKLIREASGKVLEVGIGTGANLKYYSNKCKITGIDASKEMIKYAKRKSSILGKKAKFILGKAEKLPFKNKNFDCVVSTLALCSYSNPSKSLKEMKRVCKINGKILFLEHGISNNSLIKKLQSWREKEHYKTLGCSLIRNPETITRNAGLKVLKVERSFFGIFYLIVAKRA